MGGSACEAFGLQSMSTLSASAVDIEDIQALMHTVSSCNNSAVKAAVLSLLAELLIHEVSFVHFFCSFHVFTNTFDAVLIAEDDRRFRWVGISYFW